MLLDSFYTIQSFSHNNEAIQAELILNAAHPIFQGHFPNQPVVPGACMLQMEKELLEKAVGKAIELQKAINIKYISHITPDMICSMRIQYKIVDGIYEVSGTITANEQACYKSKCKYVSH